MSSPFASEWRECLRAHYQHVVRTNDRLTLGTLSGVLSQVGFTEAELAELTIRATMHIDDVPPDFTPDMTVMVAISHAVSAPQPDSAPLPELIAAAEAAVEAAEALNEPSPDSSASDEPIAVADDAPPALYNPDAPKQMNMF